MPPRIKNSRYSEPTDLSGIVAKEIATQTLSDISVARLIDDCLVVLHREVKNLLMLSVKGKLDPNDARDLRDHLKLLFELKSRESESLRNLTDDELETAAKQALETPNDSK